jgi:hypothetical protein
MAFMISLDSRLRIKDSGFVTYGSQVTAELPTLLARVTARNRCNPHLLAESGGQNLAIREKPFSPILPSQA